MIKSTIRKSEYETIYRLLDLVSPVPYDCGTLCNAICCRTGEELMAAAQEQEQEPRCSKTVAPIPEEEPPEMGIYLLPGEDKLHSRHDDWMIWKEENAEDYAFPDSWKGKIHFVRCKTPPHCPREKRPIQCRTFPLAPHFTNSGRLVMVMNDLDLPYYCPLIEGGYTLDPAYIKATYLCWRHLIKDPLIYDFVMMDTKERHDYGVTPEIVYPKTKEEADDAFHSDIESMLAELSALEHSGNETVFSDSMISE